MGPTTAQWIAIVPAEIDQIADEICKMCVFAKEKRGKTPKTDGKWAFCGDHPDNIGFPTDSPLERWTIRGIDNNGSWFWQIYRNRLHASIQNGSRVCGPESGGEPQGLFAEPRRRKCGNGPRRVAAWYWHFAENNAETETEVGKIIVKSWEFRTWSNNFFGNFPVPLSSTRPHPVQTPKWHQKVKPKSEPITGQRLDWRAHFPTTAGHRWKVPNPPCSLSTVFKAITGGPKSKFLINYWHWTFFSRKA